MYSGVEAGVTVAGLALVPLGLEPQPPSAAAKSAVAASIVAKTDRRGRVPLTWLEWALACILAEWMAGGPCGESLMVLAEGNALGPFSSAVKTGVHTTIVCALEASAQVTCANALFMANLRGAAQLAYLCPPVALWAKS
jgi:hypothetical protein